MLFFDRLVIPEDRIFAAKIAFHISVAATAISVLRIPYNASIIAHEDMKVFAYVSIVEVILKLLIVYLLTKYVSLGSILGSITFAAGFAYFQYGNWIVMGLGIFMGLMAVVMHHQNIIRLIKGQEKKTLLFQKKEQK